MSVTTTIREIAVLRAGYPFRTGIRQDPDGEVAVVQGRDVVPGHLHVQPAADGLPRISLQDVRNLDDHLLRPEDVIFMCRGPRNCAAAVGLGVPEQAIASGSFHVLRPDTERVHPAFLAWLLNQTDAQEFMRANSSGTTIQVISLEALRSLPVRLPPLQTQIRVAELNSLIEREQALMTQLTATRQNLLRGWANRQFIHA